MKKIFALIYIIGTGVIAIATTFLQIQPALLFIDLFAPNEGDKYSIKLVVLLTWLLLLLPFIIVNTILFFVRKSKNKNSVIESWQTGIIITRKKQIQSALVGISIYVNNQKVGVVDIGNDKFFETPTGKITVIAGEGKQASDPLELEMKTSEKINLKLEIVQKGLGLKNILSR